MRHVMILALCAFATLGATAAQKLTGTPIGTENGWNYSTNSVEKDIASRLFDGDYNTYFATEERSYTWAGLDLGQPYVIKRVGWSPRNTSVGPDRVVLGVFQGANSPDFLDAIPLYIITEKGIRGAMSYADVDCSRGFRYVRYVGPSDARCNLSELEFYGDEGAGDDTRLYQLTNLPTVIVNTVGSQEPFDKETEIPGNIIILDDNKIDTEHAGGIRERGNSSRRFPKKPWRIKFEKKQSPLDAPAKAKKWTLINNYGDKSLMRNIVGFEIARRLKMKYVPYCRPVDVILNGEYKGCYQLCDQVEVNPGRVEITEMEVTDVRMPELGGGYLIEVDAYAEKEPPMTWFKSDKGVPVTIKSPKDDVMRPVHYGYAQTLFNNIEKALWNKSFTAADGYRSLLDIESVLAHFIVNETVGNPDTYWSVYMYKERGDDLFYTGPIWDLDLAFDNDKRLFPVGSDPRLLLERGDALCASGMDKFAKRVIFTDPSTKKDLQRIWSTARNCDGISVESLIRYIDDTEALLQESQHLNFMRWKILDKEVHENPRAAGSFEGEVEYLREYIRERIPNLDKPEQFDYDPTIGNVGIDDVNADRDAPVEYYNLQGMRVDNPADGLYIRRQGNTATKVLVK